MRRAVPGRDLFGQGHAAASVLPSSPCTGRGAWVQLSPHPAAQGKLLRKVQAVARPPESPGLRGSREQCWDENAVGRARPPARCHSPSLLPGTAAAGVTLRPGPQGRRPRRHWKCGSWVPRNLTSPAASCRPFGSWGAATSHSIVSRKNQIWVQVLTLPPASCVACSKLP